ncbi:MAG: OmpH family outer membrane protein [Desulfobacteraceae bacterium]|nr:OmpH family outer membrane protein [Desulfobacteraceae bacterium]MCF8095160.1 OmpH family outer membrane protein [Desulfobacteraceae bacterium]
MTAKPFKIICVCLAAAFFTVAATAGAFAGDAENIEIVTVDINRIMQQHPAFKKAQQTLQSEAQQMRQQMKEKGRQQQQAVQQQLQQRSRELQQNAMDEVRADIQKIAEEKGYEYVMDKNALISGGKEVTGEVLEEIEKQ